MIIWLTGQPGSGKSTIAQALVKSSIVNPLIIDGDELRTLFKNKNYSLQGREQNIRRAQDLALFLELKGFTPIVALVAPYREIREEFKGKTKVFEVYLHTTELRGREQYFVIDYECPLENFLDVDTTNMSAVACATIILENL